MMKCSVELKTVESDEDSHKWKQCLKTPGENTFHFIKYTVDTKQIIYSFSAKLLAFAVFVFFSLILFMAYATVAVPTLLFIG